MQLHTRSCAFGNCTPAASTPMSSHTPAYLAQLFESELEWRKNQRSALAYEKPDGLFEAGGTSVFSF